MIKYQKSEELKPQVGDVWANKCKSLKYWTVSAVAVDQVCLYIIDFSGNMGSIVEDVEDMTKENGWSIFQRDGKPCKPEREFKHGAFYPIILKGSLSKEVAHYSEKTTKFWFEDKSYYDTELNWIGEKIEIQWPEDNS